MALTPENIMESNLNIGEEVINSLRKQKWEVVTGKFLESTTRTESPGEGGEIALKEMVLNLLLIKRNYLEQYCSK